MAIDGEVSVRSGTTDVHGQEEERGGNSARFDVDVLQLVNGPAGFNPTTVDVEVQHKNYNETSWTQVASFSQFSVTGLASVAATDLRQQIRLVTEVNGDPDGWARILFLPPIWKKN